MLTDSALLEADERARKDALDVSRSFIVQAPAGSGKTELLIQRYLRLLAIVTHPEEVLAITFTRKAALEMQLRVINALRQARDGVEAKTEHEKLTIAAAAEVLSRDSAENWHLIESPARMRIETVDAFGAGIARSLPLGSGLGGAGATLADADISSVYQDAAVATLDYLTVNDSSTASVERVLVHLDNNIALFIDYIARMLASREQWLSITGAGIANSEDAAAARRQLESNIEDVINRQLAGLDTIFPDEGRDELLQLLGYAATNLHAVGKNGHPLASFRGAAGLPAPTANERRSWQAIADLLLTKQGNWRRSINKNDGFPAGDDGQKQRLYDLIEMMQERHGLRDRLDRARFLPESTYSDDQWQVLLALFGLLPLAVGELQRLFSERGVTDHNEVAISAGRALGNPDEPGDIAMILDYRIQHLLVDEMQDTSIGQYELLKKLTAGWAPDDGRTIFCVGDPMQSIYRFRDAEVGEFLLARKNGIGNIRLESLLLRRNFRSGENLVHWFNTVFLQVMPTRDDLSIGAIAYSESVPVAHHANTGEYEVHPLFGADSEAEADYTLGVIRRCLKRNGDEGLAVLVRSRAQLAALLPALRRARIEYQAIEIDRLTDLPEIIDVLALTRALCHEGDRLAWLALLRGPWVGLCWKDLHALVCNDADRTVIELCRDVDRVASLSSDGSVRLRRFDSAIEPFRARSATTALRTRIELAWFALGGPALLRDQEQLENIYRYFSALEKIEKAGSLDDVRELEQRLDDVRVSSTVSSSCRLKIMTMHKSKGLQFDHVILPGLGRATRRGDKEVLRWLNLPVESGRSEMIISPVGPRAELENDPLHQFIEAAETDKNKMELDRLLYVACTRAKKSLHLIGSVSVAPDGESYRHPVNGSLLHRLWPAIEVDYAARFETARDDTPDDTPDDTRVDTAEYLVKPVLRRFRDAWQMPAPPELPSRSADLSQDITAEGQQVEFYWVGSAARHAGTIVHRWLQRISDGQVDIDQCEPDVIEATTRRWATDLGVSDTHLNEVCERTEKALSGILSDEKGRWLLFGQGSSELPVTGIYGDRTESVVIDRIRIDENGTHWIVDYKTSTHEGGDLGGFLRQESERYRPQLNRYATLYKNVCGKEARTALYFPLLQEFCEVETDA